MSPYVKCCFHPILGNFRSSVFHHCCTIKATVPMALQSAAENCTQFLQSARVVTMRQGKSCTAEAALQFLQKNWSQCSRKTTAVFCCSLQQCRKVVPMLCRKWHSKIIKLQYFIQDQSCGFARKQGPIQITTDKRQIFRGPLRCDEEPDSPQICRWRI